MEINRGVSWGATIAHISLPGIDFVGIEQRQPVLHGMMADHAQRIIHVHTWDRDDIDVVVFLAVGPDTGKQNFISDLPDKITELKKLKEKIVIFVDGAVKKDNIAQVAAMKPDVIVTGSAVFDGKDPGGNLKFMMEAICE